VKLLFDENLSPSLVWLLRDLFSNSSQVNDCGLGAALDEQIWRYAANQGFVVVSKDLDFYERSLLLSGGPKVIWLRVGNSSTVAVERLLRSYSLEILTFDSRSDETLLILP